MGFIRRRLRKSLRRRIVGKLLKRDGANCWLCKRPMAAGEETVEHLIAVALGGTHSLGNLVLCHSGCNKHLKDRPLERKLRMQAKWHRHAS